MLESFNDFEIDSSPERIDFERVHGWLTETYWSPGVSRELVEHAARHSSLLVGVYATHRQVAYARVVSDKATFAWLCDMYVDPEFRNFGIAKAMVRFALSHPDHQGLRRWLLATKDAHGIYARCGFEPLPMPERWMVKLPRGHQAV